MIGSIPEAELPSRKAAYTGSSATASLRYLGAFATPRGPSHFWSFPNACGLAWAELTEGGTLTMPHELPQAVRDATPARAEHHTKTPTTRPAAAPPSLTMRAKPERAVSAQVASQGASVARPSVHAASAQATG